MFSFQDFYRQQSTAPVGCKKEVHIVVVPCEKCRRKIEGGIGVMTTSCFRGYRCYDCAGSQITSYGTCSDCNKSTACFVDKEIIGAIFKEYLNHVNKRTPLHQDFQKFCYYTFVQSMFKDGFCTNMEEDEYIRLNREYTAKERILTRERHELKKNEVVVYGRGNTAVSVYDPREVQQYVDNRIDSRIDSRIDNRIDRRIDSRLNSREFQTEVTNMIDSRIDSRLNPFRGELEYLSKTTAENIRSMNEIISAVKTIAKPKPVPDTGRDHEVALQEQASEDEIYRLQMEELGLSDTACAGASCADSANTSFSDDDNGTYVISDDDSVAYITSDDEIRYVTQDQMNEQLMKLERLKQEQAELRREECSRVEEPRVIDTRLIGNSVLDSARLFNERRNSPPPLPMPQLFPSPPQPVTEPKSILKRPTVKKPESPIHAARDAAEARSATTRVPLELLHNVNNRGLVDETTTVSINYGGRGFKLRPRLIQSHLYTYPPPK